MSRNSSKQPVGFATHVIAGGIAGACEAVSQHLYLPQVVPSAHITDNS